MNERKHRILKVLLAKGELMAKDIGAELPTEYVHAATLKHLQLDGFLNQKAQRKGSLWSLTDRGREAAESPLPPAAPPPKPKNDWERLGSTARPLLRELGKGRTVYKRKSKYPCLEKPIQPVAWGNGLSELIKIGLVTRIRGDLAREKGFHAYRWEGSWGVFEINENGRRVLALAPPKEA